MSVTLCVLLWAGEDGVDGLASYEDRVLALLGAHGGEVVVRVRSTESGDGPDEVHVLRFVSQDHLDAYLADPRRTVLAAERDGAIARTEILPVKIVASSR